MKTTNPTAAHASEVERATGTTSDLGRAASCALNPLDMFADPRNSANEEAQEVKVYLKFGQMSALAEIGQTQADLLAALVALRNTIDVSTINNSKRTTEIWSAVAAQADAAILKAKGQP